MTVEFDDLLNIPNKSKDSVDIFIDRFFLTDRPNHIARPEKDPFSQLSTILGQLYVVQHFFHAKELLKLWFGPVEAIDHIKEVILLMDRDIKIGLLQAKPSKIKPDILKYLKASAFSQFDKGYQNFAREFTQNSSFQYKASVLSIHDVLERNAV